MQNFTEKTVMISICEKYHRDSCEAAILNGRKQNISEQKCVTV